MSSNTKNIIVGERSNLFTVSPLRFLINSGIVIARGNQRKENVQCTILVKNSSVSNALKQSHIFGKLLPFARNDVFLLSLFLCLFISLRAQSRSVINPGDSSKIKYDINDPRNPLCPCHEYQKKADEEFAKLQRKDSQKDNLLAVSNINGSSSDNLLGKRHRTVFIKFNKRHGSKKFYKIKVLFTKEYWRKWRASTDVADCFNW